MRPFVVSHEGGVRVCYSLLGLGGSCVSVLPFTDGEEGRVLCFDRYGMMRDLGIMPYCFLAPPCVQFVSYTMHACFAGRVKQSGGRYAKVRINVHYDDPLLQHPLPRPTRNANDGINEIQMSFLLIS
jgi:hypothetical protein